MVRRGVLLCALACRTAFGPVAIANGSDLPGVWVGGIDLGRDFVPFALRIETAAGDVLTTRVQRLDDSAPAVPATSTELGDEELLVGFDRGGISWSLRLVTLGDALRGQFSSSAGSFEASFVRMASVQDEQLERVTGVFERPDGVRVRLVALPAGFLRARFQDDGRFQYLFPADDSTFFAGPTFERALPRELEVTFLDGGAALEWTGQEGESWRAARVEDEPTKLSLEGLTVLGRGLSMPLVRIEPGAFGLGQRLPTAEILERLALPSSPVPEVDPVRPTSLTHPFLIASVEVTNAWFGAFVRDTGYMTEAERLSSGLVWNGQSLEADPEASWRDPRVEISDDTPVVMVGWNDAVAFCSWMSVALGRTVRLPTEAEWEYACRAGTETLFSWGDDLDVLDEYVWGHSNANGPHAVGTLLANPWGLHDMHGNAWEWCSDFFAPIAPEPAIDPTGPATGRTRVLRGGSWINGPWQQRSAFRAGEPPGLAEPHIGFRVVVDEEAPAASLDVGERIRRIESGLLPGALIRGRNVSMTLGERMEHHRVPGLGIAVLDGGQLAWARGYGVLDAGSGEPVTEETLFLAGSVSKPVTALAALHWVDVDRLDLDEDVNRYLTGWKVPENEFTRDQKVTLRRLLSHTAGLTVHGFPGYPVDAELPSLVQVLNGERPANTDPIRVASVPGTEWRYSGGGYTVLQQLLEDVAGRSFPELMRDTVLVPAGMLHSTFENPLPSSLAAGAATGHRRDGEAVEGRWHVYPEMAAAGLWTTPSDLARYVLEVQRALEGRSTVLSRDLAREMVARQSGEYGLGPALYGVGEPSARFGHSGVDEGFETFFVGYLEGGRGAVVMLNANGALPLAMELVRAVAKEYGWPGYLPAEHVVADVPPSVYRKYAGLYEVDSESELRILVSGKRIWAQGGGSLFELLPESEVRFFSENGVTHRFELDGEGTVVAVLVETDARTIRAPRVGD